MSSNEDFSVAIAASGRYDHHQDPSSASSGSNNNTGGGGSSSGSTPHVIHAVNVTQPVQSWTVLRDHVDFMTMDVALSSAISGLPNCPNHPSFDHSHGGVGDADKVIQARNSAQEWLSAVLTVPAVRESPVMRQFLCYGANIVPPQFEDVAWINFTQGEVGGGGMQHHHHHQQQHHQQQAMAEAPVAQAPSSPTYAAVVAAKNADNNNRGGPNLDEMEMDDMFALDEDDDGHHHDDEDDDDDDDDDASYLQGRYNPTEENITQSDVMEFQQDYKEVEMVEDVGSLAQSLGASHLGRSLGLQKEMMSYKASQAKMGEQVQQMQQGVLGGGVGGSGGIHIMGNTPPSYGVNGTNAAVATASSSSPGGIGGAMAKAANNNQGIGGLNTQPFVEGLGDSFHRTVPVSAPRLDSFRMIKVIGKGSFGKFFLFRLLLSTLFYFLLLHQCRHSFFFSSIL